MTTQNLKTILKRIFELAQSVKEDLEMGREFVAFSDLDHIQKLCCECVSISDLEEEQKIYCKQIGENNV